jgi:GH15 family glucan-1,4-alpha-glucosidase
LLVASQLASDRDYHEEAERWQATAELFFNQAHVFFNTEEKHFIKGYLLSEDGVAEDKTLDISSFYGAFMFGYFADEAHITASLLEIESSLLNISPAGGSARYEDDNYFKSNPPYRGNPWFVTTLWLGQYYALNGNKQKAHEIIDWTYAHALPSGLLSEQINPENGSVVGVTPLVWSHAELISTLIDVHRA